MSFIVQVELKIIHLLKFGAVKTDGNNDQSVIELNTNCLNGKRDAFGYGKKRNRKL